jgi:hypothetical protein
MADFFARLAARLLDQDTGRLRPNLSTRFAPAPEIGAHAAPVVLPRHEPAGTRAASAPRPGSSRGRPSASTQDHVAAPSRGQPSPSAPGQLSAPPHSQPDAPSADRPDAPTARHAFLSAPRLSPAVGEPAKLVAPVPPANAASAALARDDSPRAPAGPVGQPGDTAMPERDRAAAPGEERRPYPGPRLPRDLAAPAGGPAALQSRGAGEVPADETGRTGGAQPAPAAGQSAPPAPDGPPDAVTPLPEAARVPPMPPAPRAAAEGQPGRAGGPRTSARSGEPLRPPGAGPAVPDDAMVRDGVSGARSGPPPATARPHDPPSEPRLTSREPARRPRPGDTAGEAPVRDGGHLREPAPESGRAPELTVDIELLEIVERQPPSRTPSARIPPVSLSEYLARRAR